MAERDDLAFEHDIELPVQPDPESDQDRPYAPPGPEHRRRPWARALQAVLDEPMDESPPRVTPRFYRALVGETWQQRGEECTGFALAAIVNFHLRAEKVYRALVSEAIDAFCARLDFEPAHDLIDGLMDVYADFSANEVSTKERKARQRQIDRAVWAITSEVHRVIKAAGDSEPDELDASLRRMVGARMRAAFDAWVDELDELLRVDPDVIVLHEQVRDMFDAHRRVEWWEFRAAAADLYPLLQWVDRRTPRPVVPWMRTSGVGRLRFDVATALRKSGDWRFPRKRAGAVEPRAQWLSKALVPLLDRPVAEVATRYRAVHRPLHDDRETVVSRRMLYEMAQRYDREAYAEGSTLRGALRGWDALGVAADWLWKYVAGDEEGRVEGDIGLTRMLDAVRRPGGYYFRVDGSDVEAMKEVLARGGGSYPLYASARLHAGWYRLFLPGAGERPVIRQIHGDESEGFHAFVIVGYDDDHEGFWIHNSWGEQWGDGGYGLLPYEDWLRNHGDSWAIVPRPTPELVDRAELDQRVARHVRVDESAKAKTSPKMWPHLVPIGDDGRLVSDAPYGIDKSLIKTLLYLFQEETRADYLPRLAIFADGGYLPREYAVALLTAMRDQLMRKGIFPIFLVWDTEWWALTYAWIKQLTSEVGARDLWGHDPSSPEVYEIVAESFAPRVWKEVKRRARLAVDLEDGAARLLANAVTYKWGQQRERGHPFQIHLIGHGAGDVLLAELAQLLPAPITSCTLWAPATTLRRFDATYRPMLDDGRLQHLSIFALDESHERARGVESVLHLISNILEFDWPWKAREAAFGEDATPHRPKPLLGMQRYLVADPTVGRLRDEGKLDVQIIRYPNHELLVADAVGMRNLDMVGQGYDHKKVLTETIEHITRFTDPPKPWRPTRTEARGGAPSDAVDPLVRVQRMATASRSAPPGGRPH